jgi:hypothetical protein
LILRFLVRVPPPTTRGFSLLPLLSLPPSPLLLLLLQQLLLMLLFADLFPIFYICIIKHICLLQQLFFSNCFDHAHQPPPRTFSPTPPDILPINCTKYSMSAAASAAASNAGEVFFPFWRSS